MRKYLYYRYRRRVAAAGVLLLLISAGIYVRSLVATMVNQETRPLEIGLVGTLNTVEPALLGNQNDRLLASMLYEGLFYYDEESSEIRPNLAKKWTMSSDNKTLVVTLDKDIKLSNGKKLNAADVKAAWERNLATCNDWPLSSLFLNIQGAEERLQGKASDISGIQIENDHALKISLAQEAASFPYMLANPVFWVFDCDEGGDPPYAGSGPFKVLQNNDNKSITLVRNEEYHGDKPKISGVHITVFADQKTAFQAYQQGQLDYLDSVPLDELQNIKKDEALSQQLFERPLWDSYTMGFNLDKTPFANNYLLRRALNYAVDRQNIIDEVLGGSGIPLKGVVPEGFPGFHEELRGYSYDPETAKNLLEQAGYPGGKGLPVLTLYYNNDPGHRLVADKVARQLEKVGVQVQSEALDWGFYRKQINAFNLGFFRLEWRPDYADPESILYSMYHSSRVGVSNYAKYLNPQVDKVLDDARRQKPGSRERKLLFNRAEEIIVDDAPCLFLLQRKCAKMVRSQVHGLYIDGMGNIDWLKIELFKTQV